MGVFKSIGRAYVKTVVGEQNPMDSARRIKSIFAAMKESMSKDQGPSRSFEEVTAGMSEVELQAKRHQAIAFIALYGVLSVGFLFFFIDGIVMGSVNQTVISLLVAVMWAVLALKNLLIMRMIECRKVLTIKDIF